MAEVYDVTLGGVGYMVKPGTYQRYQDGQSEGRVGRVRLFDFYGGAKRAAQLERDRFYAGAGAWPTLDSQGIVAGPAETDRTLTPAVPFGPGVVHWSFAYNGTVYVVSGAELYSVATAGGLFSDLTAVQALAATVVDCCLAGTTLYFAYGTGTNIGSYNLATSTYTAGAYADAADFIGEEKGEVEYVKSSAPTGITRASVSTTFPLDAEVLRLVTVDGHLWILTSQTVWRMTATDVALPEASTPIRAGTDDYAWAVAHFGRLWTWAGKEIVYYDTTIDSFQGSGIRGRGTLGACTVGSWLVVVVEALVSGSAEMWAYDGRGWWLLEDGTTTYSYPVSIFGSCDDADLLAGRGATNNAAATWQFFERSGSPGLRSSFELITALFDAGERDLDKVWRRAGVELATPDARATADVVTVTLSYSSDGGATWTQIATQNLTNASARLISLGGAIAAKPTSRFLQLKLAVSSVSAWCPVVVGLWAEHETMDLPTRRRRWKFTVQLSDAIVKRDGSVDATGARTLAIALWGMWDDGVVETFKDVDFDQTATSYSVRVAGIREILSKPADVALASSEVELTLVEV